MIELKEDTLQELVNKDKPTIVQFGASWCGSCRMVKPKFSKLSDEHSDIDFVYVDAEKSPESRKLATVDHLPTFALFKNGQLIKQTQGGKIEMVKELVDEVTHN